MSWSWIWGFVGGALTGLLADVLSGGLLRWIARILRTTPDAAKRLILKVLVGCLAAAAILLGTVQAYQTFFAERDWIDAHSVQFSYVAYPEPVDEYTHIMRNPQEVIDSSVFANTLREDTDASARVWFTNHSRARLPRTIEVTGGTGPGYIGYIVAGGPGSRPHRVPVIVSAGSGPVEIDKDARQLLHARTLVLFAFLSGSDAKAPFDQVLKVEY